MKGCQMQLGDFAGCGHEKELASSSEGQVTSHPISANPTYYYLRKSGFA
jgi:hypothetical protein